MGVYIFGRPVTTFHAKKLQDNVDSLYVNDNYSALDPGEALSRQQVASKSTMTNRLVALNKYNTST